MNSSNNDVWMAVAKARKDNALHHVQQEHRLKEAGLGKVNPRRTAVALLGTAVAVCLTLARKFLAI